MEPLAGYAASTRWLTRLWVTPFAALLAFGMVVTLTAAHMHPSKNHGSSAAGASVHQRSHPAVSTRRSATFSHSARSTTVLRSSTSRPSPMRHSSTSITPSRSSKISVRSHQGRVLYNATDAIAPSFAPQPAAQDERAILSYIVNGVDDGQVVVELRHGDVLVPLADLQRANLHVNPAIIVILGRAYVSLDSLVPGIAYAFNQRDLSLTITAQSQYLSPTVVDLTRGNRPRDIMYPQNSSFFFNYALDWTNFSQLADFSELGISSHGNLYYTGFNVGPTGRIVRGLTNATFDNPSLMKRWIVGDALGSQAKRSPRPPHTST